MTSANVYYIDFLEIPTNEWDPLDKSTWKAGDNHLHRERCHALTSNRFNWDKILSLPLDSTEVYTWGYDEEEEEWGCQDEWDIEGGPEPLPTLREWIEKVKPTDKALREKLNQQ